MWGTMTPEETLAEHVIDIRRIAADFRDAFERIQTSSTRASGVNKFFTSQSPLQMRLSVYNWNPGPRRGTEDAIEKQIAGKWHLITLQEASDYVDHAILHERFHVTHFAGCAVLFNKDTFYTRRCQVHLPPRHQADIARSFCRRRTRMGLTRRSVTRLLSALHPVDKQPSPFYHYARFPRSSSVCNCVFLAFLRSRPEFC